MKYAIFSDIHGNSFALKAALADAEKYGVDKFLMLGDYYSPFPWGDEVIDIIRGIDSAVVVRGNGEGYLTNLHGQDQKEWIYEQFKPIYWGYRMLKPENLEYLLMLPDNITISDDGLDINLTHLLKIFFRNRKIKYFHNSTFRIFLEQEKKTYISHEEYLKCAREELLSLPDVLEEINALPKGIYLFGHNHMQFYVEYNGRIFINPGSCGSSCDYDPTASYTILEISGDNLNIIERRISYDINLTVGKLRESDFTAGAPEWSRIIEKQLITGKDYFGTFVMYLTVIGKELGQTEFPVSNYIFEEAVRKWDWEL